jgi:hypothetical protein
LGVPDRVCCCDGEAGKDIHAEVFNRGWRVLRVFVFETR